MLKIKPNIKNSKAFGLVVAGLTLAMISTCSTSAMAEEQERLIEKNSVEQMIVPFTIEYLDDLKKQEKLDYQFAVELEIAKEELRINNPRSKQSKFVDEALKHNNTGRWIFGGSTPGAWDCSGFVMYVAKKTLGLELYHSATVQMDSGIQVDVPIKGDLVGLYYQNSSTMSSHIGIYVGDGSFIHVSNSRGTVVSKISKYEDNYDVRYSRIIDKDRDWDPHKELEKRDFLFFNQDLSN
jgi:hypothetical protein